jgi:hypothetical protein
MRVTVNEGLVRKRAATAQRGILIGVGLLGAAAVLSFNPQYVLRAYGLIIPGVILASWAARFGDKWLREPRADQLLAKALKGLTQGYRLYSYVLPAEHVILSPMSVFVLNVKRQDGRISCHGDRWHRPLTLRRAWRFLAEEPLGNPTKQVRDEMQKLQQFIAERLPDEHVPVHPVIVFTESEAELEFVEPALATMPLSDLKSYLRGVNRGETLPKHTQRALRDLFDDQLP